MITHLEKAKAALDEARNLTIGDEVRMKKLLAIADVQAKVSIAESLNVLADSELRRRAWQDAADDIMDEIDPLGQG